MACHLSIAIRRTRAIGVLAMIIAPATIPIGVPITTVIGVLAQVAIQIGVLIAAAAIRLVHGRAIPAAVHPIVLVAIQAVRGKA